jgi:hypothetical protein
MRNGLRIGATLAALLIGAGDAAAQSIYVFGGTAQVWRRTGWRQQSIDDLGPTTKPTPSVLAGAGWWLKPALGIEGSIELLRRQTLSWHYGYMADTDLSTEDHDVPILGHLRIAPLRARHVSLEALIGGGLTWHGIESFVIRQCSPVFSRDCSTPNPPTSAGTYGTWEWTFSSGLELPIRLTDHVTLAPSARVLYAHRRRYLTPTDFRGPASGPGRMPSIGLTLRWTPR